MPNATLTDGATGASCRTPSSLATQIRGLSDRLVEAQRPLRILDAVKWGDEVERAFFAAGARELPAVTRDTYALRPLPFRPDDKLEELATLEWEVRRTLGVAHPAGRRIRWLPGR